MTQRERGCQPAIQTSHTHLCLVVQSTDETGISYTMTMAQYNLHHITVHDIRALIEHMCTF